MFKELRFDVVGAVSKTDKYDGEREAIHQFNSSEHKNMVFDYDTDREARNATQWIVKAVEKEKMPLKVSLLRKKSVLIKKK